MQTPYSMIVVIVNNGYSDAVMTAAREAGASGGTLLHGRGSGKVEENSILGIAIAPEKEIVMIVARENDRQNIMRAIYAKTGLNTEADGYSFSIPVEDIIGAAGLKAAGRE